MYLAIACHYCLWLVFRAWKREMLRKDRERIYEKLKYRCALRVPYRMYHLLLWTILTTKEARAFLKRSLVNLCAR